MQINQPKKKKKRLSEHLNSHTHKTYTMNLHTHDKAITMQLNISTKEWEFHALAIVTKEKITEKERETRIVDI